MVERLVQLIDGMGAESIAYFWPIESDPDDTVGALGSDVAVIRDVGEIGESGNWLP